MIIPEMGPGENVKAVRILAVTPSLLRMIAEQLEYASLHSWEFGDVVICNAAEGLLFFYEPKKSTAPLGPSVTPNKDFFADLPS
jgi:hypothetical protein